MWPTGGATFDTNGIKFSPCSVRDVTKALRAKAHLCFKSSANLDALCGDGLLSPPEDCDKGTMLHAQTNKQTNKHTHTHTHTYTHTLTCYTSSQPSTFSALPRTVLKVLYIIIIIY